MALLFSAFLPNARHGERLGYLEAFVYSIAILIVAGQAESELAARTVPAAGVRADPAPRTGMFAGVLGSIELVRERLAAAPLWHTEPAIELTFSAGLGSPAATESHATFLSRVDAALYAAKAAGRNQTAVVDPGEVLVEGLYADRREAIA